MNKSTWQDIAHQVQCHRTSTLDQVQPPIPDIPSALPSNVTDLPKRLLSARENEITTKCVEALLPLLASGALTSVEVTTAFLRRAGVAQKLTNCVTELLPERSLRRANELDWYLAEHKRPYSPLHGLPISVKEHIAMKDLGLNAGFMAWVGRKAQDDALVLKILWEAGCIFYVRTTEPQTLMHLETSSNIYGVTANPFNLSLTPGGSSGGEGALIALRGSCLGIGSDIGGSIRSPAANNGLYGLRPTSYRIPSLGNADADIGSGCIKGTLGPLSTSLEGIKTFMKTVLAAKPWITEPSLLPLPWRDTHSYLQGEEMKKLKVAVLWDDGVVIPHPPITRALSKLVEKLDKLEGIEIVEWKPYKHDLAWDLIASLYFVDGGDQTRELIDSVGEPWRPLSRFIVENSHVKHRTPAEIQELRSQRDAYCYEYAQLWNSTAASVAKNGDLEGAIDVILCPASPGAAPPFDSSRYWGYTSQWNLLDFPALVFPVTAVDPALDVRPGKVTPRNDQDQFNQSLYDDPDKYAGLPVSLQLVGRRYDDEKTSSLNYKVMDRFSVAKDIAELLPNMQVVIVAAYNLTNTGTSAQVTHFAEETVSATLSNLSAYANAQSHPRIALYRNTLKEKCNLSAKKFPQSNESLYRRLLKENQALRPINPVVDFYNAISIKHGVTAGAFDLGELQTRSVQPLELRMSAAGDLFRALDADSEAQPIEVGPGEVIYAQDSTVLTRHLAWRQAAECLVTEKTRNVIFMCEVPHEQGATGAMELAREVAGDLVDGLSRFFGVQGQASILGKEAGVLTTEVNNAFY